jgi:hypothetical protein
MLLDNACLTAVRQTHECRIKLDGAGENACPISRHLSTVRVAIYVAYLKPMHYALQHKESIHELLYSL